MNVTHVIIGLDADGAELMLKRLIKSSNNKSGLRHSVISLKDTGKVGLQLQSLGVEVHALDLRSPLDIPRVFWQLVRIFKDSRPDVIQTWMYHADLLGGMAARLAGNRNIIWGIRSGNVISRGATAMVRKACAWLSHCVPHTIVCAAEASRRAHIAVGYDAARMVVVHNGFDLSCLVATPEQREAMRMQFGLGSEFLVIGHMARFHKDKDTENFVQAAGIVAHQHSNARFLMLGRGQDANNTLLVDWIAKTGYGERFILLGEREDVPSCLAAMDFFCLSSRTEGFPNAVGEAMAMGLPCVVTDVGDAAMLIADTGIVVPKENSKSLALGLGRMLAMTSDTRQQMGRKAQKRIYTEFSIDQTRKHFEDIYQQVTKKG